MYHGVIDSQPEGVPLIRSVTAAALDRDIAFLKRHFTVLPIQEWIDAVRSPTRTNRRIATITFDDGYENNLLYGVPVLESHGVTACFFLTLGNVESGAWLDHDLLPLAVCASNEERQVVVDGKAFSVGTGDWALRVATFRQIEAFVFSGDWKRCVRLSRQLYEDAGSPQPAPPFREQFSVLSRQQAGEMVSRHRMVIGSHTMSHANLRECIEQEIADELSQSAALIAEIGNIPIAEQVVAYPLGGYDDRVMRIAKELGFKAAMAVDSYCCPSADTLYRLPRIGIWDHDDLADFAFLASGTYEAIGRLKRRMHQVFRG